MTGDVSGVLQGELITISDIHLRQMDSPTGRSLLGFLREVERGQVDCLVLLGDVFEFILGSKAWYRRKFTDLGRALSRVAASGTEVVFIEGNHEFRMSAVDWEGVRIVEDRDFRWQSRDGTVFRFTHGDLIYSPLAYMRFRAVVRSTPFVALAHLVPAPIMDWLSLKSAKLSRDQDQYRQLDHSAILGALGSWAEEEACDYALFGHFHFPVSWRRTPDSPMLLCMNCWDEPNGLVYHDGRFQRLSIGPEGQVAGFQKLVPAPTEAELAPGQGQLLKSAVPAGSAAGPG